MQVPVLDGKPRFDKPPLATWVQAAALGFDGDSAVVMWRHRLPSLLAALVAGIGTWAIGLRLALGNRASVLAGSLLVACPLVWWEARQARADLLLLAAVVGVVLVLVRLVHRPGRLPAGEVVLGGLALGLGMLAKGPIVLLPLGLVLVGLTVARRRVAWFGVVGIVGLTVLVLLVWVLPASASQGWRGLADIAIRETLGRSLEPREGHTGPPGYHMAFALVLFWPGILGLPLALRDAVGRALRRRPVECVLLVWVLGIWVVVELVATKLPHYLLPAYPAMALLAGRALSVSSRWVRRPVAGGVLRVLAIAWGAGSLVLPPLMLVVPAIWRDRFDLAGLGVLAVLPGASWLLWCWRDLVGGRIGRALPAGLLLSLALAAVGVGVIAPRLHVVDLAVRVAAVVEATDPQGHRPVIAVGCLEESWRLLRPDWITLDPAAAAVWLQEHPGGLVVLNRAERWRLPAARELGTVEGFDLGSAEWRSLVVLEAE